MSFMGKHSVKFSCEVLVFVFILIFLFSSSAQAANRNYQRIHGQELNVASVEIRQAFYEDYGWDWYESYYESRKEFLDIWYSNLDKNKKLERRKVKADRNKARVENQKKRRIIRSVRNKQRAALLKRRNKVKRIIVKNKTEKRRRKRFQKKNKKFKKKMRNLRK